MTPMRVLDLSTCRLTGQPALLLGEMEGGRRLAFYLPLNEANRLARVLGRAECACSPVFDLVETLVGTLAARVLRAELEGDADGISGALVLMRDGAELYLPAHPADALALALRAAAPIVARPGALAQARHAGADEPPAATEAPGGVQAWLERLRPTDFRVED